MMTDSEKLFFFFCVIAIVAAVMLARSWYLTRKIKKRHGQM